jgi:hypothetical protein
MALAHSPSITTSGLVLCLDAGNTKSYPGSGTTWTDLSGNGNNGTFVNTPTYSSSNKGSIIFDSTDYVTTSAVVESATNSNLQTFSGWLVGDGALFGSNASGIGQNHLRASLSGTTLTYRVSYYGGAAGEIDDTTTVSPFSINNIVIVKTAAEKYDVYFNAVKVMNQVTKKASVSTSFYPGLYYSGSYNNGTVCNYMIYNRALTASEIQQNFNALRGRFSI